jgi:hypothetical protein
MAAADQEHTAAAKRWRRRERAAERRTGYRNAQELNEEARQRSADAIDELCDTRPRTFAGLVAKARAVPQIDPDDIYEFGRAWLLDIAALAGAAEA